LASDVYHSAAHEPASPGLGWIRVSEHPELLRKRLGVEWTDQQIEDYLQPMHSDFRAEIYLPDPCVYGPDVLPVIAIKGSNGLIAVPDGKGGISYRESALEDWIDNGRQGIGLESNHADRAMTLASDFQRDYHRPFESVGHSKGGVGCSAAATLTGTRGYVFNSAGLHPNTVQRYAAQNHMKVAGDNGLIHSYYVEGEVLRDTQQGIHDMGWLTRLQVGATARQLAELGQMKDVRALAQNELAKALPYDPKMQADALQFVDYLGSHSGAELLKGVPLAAGEQQIKLTARSRDAQGQWVDRPAAPSLTQVGDEASPLMQVISGGLLGATLGRHAGDSVALGGQIAGDDIQWAGRSAQQGVEIFGYVLNEQVQGPGRLVAGAMHYGGAAAADMRMVYGQAEFLVEEGKGRVAQWSHAMSDAIQRAESHLPFLQGLKQVAEDDDRATVAYVDRRHEAATQALRDAGQDAGAIRGLADTQAEAMRKAAAATGQAVQRSAEHVGRAIGEGSREAGAAVRNIAGYAPEAGAAAGAAFGAFGVAAGEVAIDPIGVAVKTRYVADNAAAAASEAVSRHGVEGVILPSLDARTREMEIRAIEQLHTREATASRETTKSENLLGATVQRMLKSAQEGDWDAFRTDLRALADMQAGKDLRAAAVADADRQQAALQTTVQETPPSLDTGGFRRSLH
jgi:hypothetical protein